MHSIYDVRICSRCHHEKLLLDFYGRGPDRWDNTCKDCRKEERRSRYARQDSVIESPPVKPSESEEFIITEPQYLIRFPSEITDAERVLTENEWANAIEVFSTLQRWRDEDPN